MHELIKEELKDILLPVYSRSNIGRALWDCYPDIADKFLKTMFVIGESEDVPERYVDVIYKVLALWYLEKVITDDVVKYLNEHMEYHLLVESIGDSSIAQEYVDCIKNVCEIHRADPEDNDLKEYIPVLGNVRSVCIGYDMAERGGVLDDFSYTIGVDTYYLTETGDLIAAKEYRYSLDDKSESGRRTLIMRVPDDCIGVSDYVVPYELESLFPEEYRFL